MRGEITNIYNSFLIESFNILVWFLSTILKLHILSLYIPPSRELRFFQLLVEGNPRWLHSSLNRFRIGYMKRIPCKETMISEGYGSETTVLPTARLMAEELSRILHLFKRRRALNLHKSTRMPRNGIMFTKQKIRKM